MYYVYMEDLGHPYVIESTDFMILIPIRIVLQHSLNLQSLSTMMNVATVKLNSDSTGRPGKCLRLR